MARGQTLASMKTDLKIELGQSLAAGHQPDWNDLAAGILRSEQEHLWLTHRWPFLEARPEVALVAATRYYALPANVELEEIERIHVVYDKEYYELGYGIGDEQYNTWDSAGGEKADLVRRWEYLNVADGLPIEVWPVPEASNIQKLRFIVKKGLDPLTDDAHTSTLDGRLVVLHAAARFAEQRQSKDARTLRAKASDYLGRMIAHTVKSSVFAGMASPEGEHSGRVYNPEAPGTYHLIR